MSAYDIAPGAAAALESFVLPEKLGFGAVNAPVMFSAEWRDGQWQRGTLLPYGRIEVWPGSRALQYAELVFEGLKAYQVEQARRRWRSSGARCARPRAASAPPRRPPTTPHRCAPPARRSPAATPWRCGSMRPSIAISRSSPG